jgi:hypothetical protein
MDRVMFRSQVSESAFSPKSWRWELDGAKKEKHVFIISESIKPTYKVKKVWTGDPCSPRLFPWKGILLMSLVQVGYKDQ